MVREPRGGVGHAGRVLLVERGVGEEQPQDAADLGRVLLHDAVLEDAAPLTVALPLEELRSERRVLRVVGAGGSDEAGHEREESGGRADSEPRRGAARRRRVP
jgi:hypothetical protein